MAATPTTAPAAQSLSCSAPTNSSTTTNNKDVTMWCHKCHKGFKRLSASIACPLCWEGFTEEVTLQQQEAYKRDYEQQQEEEQQRRQQQQRISQQSQSTSGESPTVSQATSPPHSTTPAPSQNGNQNFMSTLPQLLTLLQLAQLANNARSNTSTSSPQQMTQQQQQQQQQQIPAAVSEPVQTVPATPLPTPSTTPVPEVPVSADAAAQQSSPTTPTTPPTATPTPTERIRIHTQSPVLMQFVTLTFPEEDSTSNSPTSTTNPQREPITMVFVTHLDNMHTHVMPMRFTTRTRDNINVPLPEQQQQQRPGVFHPGDYLSSNAEFQALLNHLFRSSQPQGAPPATEKAIDSLQQVHATKEQVDQSEQCPVCKDEYELDMELLQLPCKHTYHPDCIKHWLKMHNTCPLCRAPVSSKDETVVNEQASETSQAESQLQR